MEKTNAPCPRRLHDESILLNKSERPAWMPRRANKMRERFSSEEQELLEAVFLVAPVQPTTRQTLQQRITIY